MEYLKKDNFSIDKRDLLITCVQWYKNECLKVNGNNYNCFSINFLDELLEELKKIN